MREASLATLCVGEATPFHLIEQQLLVGQRVGAIDEGVPQMPLFADLARWQRKLKLKPEARDTDISLDLSVRHHRGANSRQRDHRGGRARRHRSTPSPRWCAAVPIQAWSPQPTVRQPQPWRRSQRLHMAPRVRCLCARCAWHHIHRHRRQRGPRLRGRALPPRRWRLVLRGDDQTGLSECDRRLDAALASDRSLCCRQGGIATRDKRGADGLDKRDSCSNPQRNRYLN
jgi:hypothetical protein